MAKKNSYYKFVFILLVLLIAYSFSFTKTKFKEDDLLHIWILDVGQGDSIFIKTPEEKYILVDAYGQALEMLRRRLPTSGCKLDLVVLTHPHFDHFSGLSSIINQCQIMTYGESILNAESKSYLALDVQVEEASKSGKIKYIEEVDEGDVFEFGEIKLRVLWPEKNSEDYSNFNIASVVMLGSYKSFDFLLTGDAEKVVYDELLDKNPNISQIEFLKYPHHGSADSYNPEFLRKIDPKVSVISVGEGNKYGHPSKFVLDELRRLGSTIYRTDLSGTVEIISDGNTFKVYTEH